MLLGIGLTINLNLKHAKYITKNSKEFLNLIVNISFFFNLFFKKKLQQQLTNLLKLIKLILSQLFLIKVLFGTLSTVFNNPSDIS